DPVLPDLITQGETKMPHHPQPRDRSHLHLSYLLSRRAFLRTTLLLGSGVAVGSLAGACAPASSGPQTGAAPAAEQSATGPVPGGVYRLVGQGDFRTLDPPGAESSED